MADRKISDLTALTTPASGDYVPIVDISEAAAASKNKRVTIQSLFQGIPVNVGIGTTDMYGTLNVQRNTTSQYSTISLGDFAAANNSVGIYGRVSSSGIFGISSAGAPIVFYNTGSGTGEAVRIDSSGRVGIGTASPATALHVSTASSTAATLQTSGTDVYLRLQNSVNTGGYVGYNSSALTLWTTDLERLRVDSSGRVGIGTTSPTTLLDVNADTVRVRTARTPASASATGATGEICWDANYIYVCTATNTWKRTALSTW